MVDKILNSKNFLKKEYPECYEVLSEYHSDFKAKPRFNIHYDNGELSVLREDFDSYLTNLSTKYDHQLGEQISISEYRVFKDYHGDGHLTNLSKTNHDIFRTPGNLGIIKLGNPERDNAPYEFLNAMTVKYFRGIAEMESPIGFKAYEDKKEMSGIFYKYLEGNNLWRISKTSDYALSNSMLWDVGKLFSRLVQNNVFFYDANRLNNYFIEKIRDDENNKRREPHLALRLLDAEYIMPTNKLEKVELEYMIKNFVNTSLSIDRNGKRFLD